MNNRTKLEYAVFLACFYLVDILITTDTISFH